MHARLAEALRPLVSDDDTVRRLQVGDEVLYSPVLDASVIPGETNSWRVVFG